MRRLDQLTFTRFWALLLVLIYHGAGGIYIQAINKFPVSAILYSAPTAVSYLYVLSGFVMSLVYFRPEQKFDVRSYWTSRFVRIYPLYIVSFLLVCYFYLDYMAHIKPLKVLMNIFVLQAWWPPYAQSFNYASWSMTVEFFFYAVFPFFTMWAYKQRTSRLIWISLGLWAVTQLIHFILWTGYFPAWELFIVYNPVFHLSSFIIGVVGGIWFVREGQTTQVSKGLNLAILAGSLVLIAGYIVLSNIYLQLPHDLQPMSGLLSPFFILFILTLALDTTRLSSLLSHPWLVTLGETAFALYILHVPVIWLYERALFTSAIPNPEFVMSVTYLPLMISVGLIAYLYVDPPIRRWMKNALSHVTMPLLILDLFIFGVSAYASVRLRFPTPREFALYRETALIIFWAAFFFRTSSSYIFRTLDPANLDLPLKKLAYAVVLSVTAGSGVVAALLYAAYAAGWIENFPRSILLIDWVIVVVLSVAVRLMLGTIPMYKKEPFPAQ